MTEKEKQDQYIEIWSKVVDTQMHFNEMQVKSRQLGLTFVTAALGVAFVLLSSGDDFSLVIWKFELHVSVLLVFGSWLALQAVKKLDLGVYHPMLRGAVTFGMDFEENYMKKVFSLEKGMTQSITHFSRFSDAKVDVSTGTGKYTYSGDKSVTAEGKIGEFYKQTSNFLLWSTFALAVFTNLTLIDEPESSDSETVSDQVPEALMPESTNGG